jgi:hypothetical protein
MFRLRRIAIADLAASEGLYQRIGGSPAVTVNFFS